MAAQGIVVLCVGSRRSAGAFMVKVAHVITNLNPGGAETFLARLLVDRARAEGVDPGVVVALGSGGAVRKTIEDAGIEVHTLCFPGPNAVVRLSALLRRLRELRIEVVQGWMYHGDLVASLIGTLLGVPVAWNIRTSIGRLDEIALRTRLALAVSFGLSNGPRRIVYNSHKSRRDHEAFGFPTDSGVVIPNGVDLHRFVRYEDAGRQFRQGHGIDQGRVVVGMVGRNHLDKGVDLFLRVREAIGRECDGVVFLALGRGVPELTGLDAGPPVVLLDHVDDVVAALSAMDVFVLPSRREGWPNALAEAMACSLPVVATDVGDVAAILGGQGTVVERDDIRGLAAGVRELVLAGGGVRSELGAAMRRRAEESFPLSAVVEDYDSLYRDLAAAVRKEP